MARPLVMALAQAPQRQVDTALPEFADEVRDLVGGFPRTQFIMYPEYHLVGVDGTTPEERLQHYREIAEPLDGPRAKRLGALAEEVGRWLLPGTVIERGAEGELFNTAVVFSPQGELVAAYRKIFPWRPFEPWTPGGEFVVFDIPGVGRFGLSICYDTWFPEVTRSVTWLGAEVILTPTHTTTSDREQETVLARGNAIANQVFFVGLNSGAPAGTGKSIVVDPEGHVLVEAFSEAPVVLTQAIDLDQVTLVRKYGTAALNRPWSQFAGKDAPLELPMYQGRIDPGSWDPSGRVSAGEKRAE